MQRRFQWMMKKPFGLLSGDEQEPEDSYLIKEAKKNLEKIELFDLFADEKTLGANKESAAYRLTFRATDRTLTDDEVNKAYNKLRDRLAADLKVELR